MLKTLEDLVYTNKLLQKKKKKEINQSKKIHLIQTINS